MQYLKALSHIRVRWGGNVKLSIDVRENALYSIAWSSESGENSTVLSFSQFSKAFSHIRVRWGGNVKLSINDPENACSSIACSSEFDGNSTVWRYLQL